MKLLTMFKTTAFLVWFIAGLSLVCVGTSMWAVQATVAAARLATETANIAVRHRKELAATVMRVKAKARLKRMVTMIPLAGLAAGAYFEEQEYQEWLADNPNLNRSDYLCELPMCLLMSLRRYLSAYLLPFSHLQIGSTV